MLLTLLSALSANHKGKPDAWVSGQPIAANEETKLVDVMSLWYYRMRPRNTARQQNNRTNGKGDLRIQLG